MFLSSTANESGYPFISPAHSGQERRPFSGLLWIIFSLVLHSGAERAAAERRGGHVGVDLKSAAHDGAVIIIWTNQTAAKVRGSKVNRDASDQKAEDEGRTSGE